MTSPLAIGLRASAIWLAATATAGAVPVLFTDRAAFDAEVAGLVVEVVDFESVPAGTPVPDGTAFGNVTLTYDRDLAAIGLDLVVTDQFTATSGANYLGVDDGGSELFFNADGLLMDFAQPVLAVGLFLITPENAAFPGDFTLSAAGTTVSSGDPDFQIATGDPATPFDDVLFLGIVDTDAAITTATLASLDPTLGFVTFNIDDIVTARAGAPVVPAPASLALLGLGVVLVAAGRDRRGASPATS